MTEAFGRRTLNPDGRGPIRDRRPDEMRFRLRPPLRPFSTAPPLNAPRQWRGPASCGGFRPVPSGAVIGAADRTDILQDRLSRDGAALGVASAGAKDRAAGMVTGRLCDGRLRTR